MLDTQNRRRAAGCHPCLSVPALPNVGLAAPDRPQLAWVYPEQYEQAHAYDLVQVIEALSATGVLMESLCAAVLVEDSLSASPAVAEALSAAPMFQESLSATASVQDSLSASVTVFPC